MSSTMNNKEVKELFANFDNTIRRSESAIIREFAQTLETYREEYMKFLKLQEELNSKLVVPRNRQSINIISPFIDEKEFFNFARETLTLFVEEVMLLVSVTTMPHTVRSTLIKQYEQFSEYIQKISDRKSYDVAMNAITMLVKATIESH